MAVPAWMPQPQTPAVRDPYTAGVKVISQVPSTNNTILVTFSTTALQTFTIRVPESTWLEGQHLAVGPFVLSLLTAIEEHKPDWSSHGGE